MTLNKSSHNICSFSATAETYESCLGGSSRAVARYIALTLDLRPNARVCDNACGTGAVTEAILEQRPDVQLFATDSSSQMVDLLSNNVLTRGRMYRLEIKVQSSLHLDYPDEFFDFHVMNFALYFSPDPVRVAIEMYRTTKRGGGVVVTCVKQATLWGLFFHVQQIVHPTHPVQHLSMFEDWSDPETVTSVLQAGGFTNVHISSCPGDGIATTVGDFSRSCAESVRKMAGDSWTVSEKDRIEGALAQIWVSHRDEYLAVGEDGSTAIRLVAWVATATKL